MKNKVLIAVLSLICIISVAYNIYQYNMLNANRQQLVNVQSQLNNMTNSYADLDAKLVAMQEQLDALNINMADKQSEIDSLAKENSDLVSSISELEESIEEAKRIAEEKAMEEQKVIEEQKAIETAQAEQTAPTQNFDPDLQAETLQRLQSLGGAVGGFNITTSEVGNSTFSTGAVLE